MQVRSIVGVNADEIYVQAVVCTIVGMSVRRKGEVNDNRHVIGPTRSCFFFLVLICRACVLQTRLTDNAHTPHASSVSLVTNNMRNGGE